jgi:hypothetical protein
MVAIIRIYVTLTNLSFQNRPFLVRLCVCCCGRGLIISSVDLFPSGSVHIVQLIKI